MDFTPQTLYIPATIDTCPSSEKPLISVVIPAYNEEGSVVETVTRIRTVLADREHEIIVVDDGSSDDTARLAASAGAHVVSKVHNVGYGHSLKLGIASATHDTIVILDADGTYPVEEIPRLLARYEEGFDLVVAARTGAHYRESALKHPLRVVLKALVEFTAGRRIPDVNSGLRVFSKKTVTPFFPNLSDSFSFTTSQTLAYMLRAKFVDYIPVDYHKRVGETKVRLFRDSLRTLQFIVQAILHYNPLKLFLVLCLFTGLPSLLLGLAGVALLSWPLIGMGFAGAMVTILIFSLGLISELLKQILRAEKDS